MQEGAFNGFILCFGTGVAGKLFGDKRNKKDKIWVFKSDACV
jgi:hypothetical protein